MTNLEEIVKSSDSETRQVLEEFVHTLAESIKENKILKQKNDYISHENRLLRKKLFGSSSEKIKSDDSQYQCELSALFDEFELCSQEVSIDVEEPPTADLPNQPTQKKRPGRKPLPKDLPRTVIEHDLSDDEKQCECGHSMEAIGTQVSEELHYKPAELKVLEHRCKTYGCARCNTANKKAPSVKAQLKTAHKPKQLIPKSYASPSLLAAIVTNKFCDHLPLYRLEGIFKRSSVELSRQTMSTWMLKVSEAVIPLVNLLQDEIHHYDVAYADETTIQVLKERDRRAETKSYMWCFIGGPPGRRSHIYQYHPSRKGDIATTFFDGYQGALHCDGYAGYDALLNTEGITGVNCLSHARRKFHEALPGGKEKGVSGFVVRLIRELYKIEEMLKATYARNEKIKTIRQEKSKPLLEKLKAYLDEKSKCVPPQSKVGKAIQYTRKRWRYFVTYLEDGRYEIDNNRAERAIKPFVMGRKAWLFANSEAGAHASARLFTLVESAKANDVEPSVYLETIFKELPNCSTIQDYEALLPWNYKLAISKNS